VHCGRRYLEGLVVNRLERLARRLGDGLKLVVRRVVESDVGERHRQPHVEGEVDQVEQCRRLAALEDELGERSEVDLLAVRRAVRGVDPRQAVVIECAAASPPLSNPMPLMSVLASTTASTLSVTASRSTAATAERPWSRIVS